LYNADECFLTGTGAKLIPVREIDGRKITHCPGTTYQRLSQAFAELIAQETSE
jgi:branched-chain amino acid aminotransferase